MNNRVKIQKTRVTQSSKDASHTEQSQYWDDVLYRRNDDAISDSREHPQANPDVLPETKIVSPSTPQFLMGEAIEHLQGRQREVYLLLMRDGKTQAEAAKILGVGRTAVESYKQRAVRFITQYCRRAIVKGRV